MATKNSATSTNLAPNTAAALCYIPVVGWVAAVVLLIVEKHSTVKWHAVQSLLLMAAIWGVGFVLGVTVILALLVPLVWIAGLVLQLVLAVKAFQGKIMKLPVLGAWTDKLAGKI